MSSVLRSVRKRKKGRRLGAVDVIDREEYAELEVDAKVELIRIWQNSDTRDPPCWSVSPVHNTTAPEAAIISACRRPASQRSPACPGSRC